jgi:hypothetical protein
MSEPRLHHLVPQFLLKRFATVSGSLELIDRYDFARITPSFVPAALAVRDFYSLDTPNGLDASIEKLLATHVEGPAATAIRRLVDEGRSLAGPGIRIPIGIFLGFQKVRGPGDRHAMAEYHNAVTRLVASLAPDDTVRAPRPRRIREREVVETIELARAGKYEIVSERAADLHIDGLDVALNMARDLESRTWQLLEFDEPVLATCDEPVVLMGRNVNLPGEPVGVLTAEAVAFATDPRHALIMIRRDLEAAPGRHRGSHAEAAVLNAHVAFAAFRHIVRRPGTDPLAELEVPKKAAPVWTVGNMVGIEQNASRVLKNPARDA